MTFDSTDNPVISNKTPAGTPGAGGPRPERSRHLVVLSVQSKLPGAEGRLFKLHKDRIVLGSVISADVRLQGEGVAPIHAVLEVSAETGEATVYDLASDSGVFVNERKVVTEKIKSGDRIRVGHHVLEFGLEDARVTSAKDRVQETEGRKLYMNPTEDFTPLLLQDEREVVEIFDFGPTSKRALEVVMSWANTILDVEHFVESERVMVGTEKDCDFGIPPVMTASRFPMITREGTELWLNLDHQMKGVIQRQGRLQTLEQVRNLGRAGVNGPQIAFGPNDFAKIRIGEIDFYLSYTSAPPRLKTRRLLERDPLFQKIIATSLILTGLTLTALMRISVPEQLEAEQMPERIATILYQPEKYSSVRREPTPPPVKAEPQASAPKPVPTTKIELKPNQAPKPVPKEMNVGKNAPKVAQSNPSQAASKSKGQREAAEGEGARAKGTEGKRGTRKAPKGAEPQKKAMRPSPQGGNGAGGGGKSQVVDEGNVDLLKGAGSKIQDILGNSAANLGKGGEKLQGFGVFDSRGNNGLALSGDGKGGGGNAASLGGLSDKGKGGGRVGTGKGAAGSGTGIVGGRARVEIRTGGPEESIVMGSIDADAVLAAILAHKDEFRLCYEREINADRPANTGSVGTSFVIGASGRVTQAGIESTSLKNPNVERCVLGVIRRIDFPIPRGAGIVQVSFPFKFNALK